MTGKAALSRAMTEAEFDNGYWYAEELRAFAVKEGVPAAARLRRTSSSARPRPTRPGRRAEGQALKPKRPQGFP